MKSNLTVSGGDEGRQRRQIATPGVERGAEILVVEHARCRQVLIEEDVVGTVDVEDEELPAADAGHERRADVEHRRQVRLESRVLEQQRQRAGRGVERVDRARVHQDGGAVGLERDVRARRGDRECAHAQSRAGSPTRAPLRWWDRSGAARCWQHRRPTAGRGRRTPRLRMVRLASAEPMWVAAPVVESIEISCELVPISR